MLKLKVVSDSMMPLIPIGAMLEVEKIHEDYKFQKFDILLFQVDNKLMCHFFWHQNKYFDKDLIITRNLKDGDFDHPFPKAKVIGLVKNYKLSFFHKLRIFFFKRS